MKTISIGKQDFASLREADCFYIDKTSFISEWWECMDEITLITRPRRFGKTLNLNMLECFFSNKYAGREDLFEGLSIWQEEKYRKLQGTYPVLFLTFADVKAKTYSGVIQQIKSNITTLYNQYDFLMKKDFLNRTEKRQFNSVNWEMNDEIAVGAIRNLMGYLSRYYGKKVIILLDEYDTPMQEAYLSGFWEEITFFFRSMFNITLKTNPYLERGIMSGITRVSKESVFSDLNNLKVVTTTSNIYETAFGFTEEEVFAVLEEADMEELLEGKAFYTELDEQIVFQQLEGSVSALCSMLLASGYLKVAGYRLHVRTRQKIYELRLTNFEIELMFEKMIAGWFEKPDSRYHDFVNALLKGNLEEMNYYMNKVALAYFQYI